MAKLAVLGIGARPFDKRGRKAVLSAEIIVGPRRLCELFAGCAQFPQVREKIRQIDKPDETIDFIRGLMKAGMEHIVLLASGDPLFFGIGRKALQEFGRESVEILPDVSSVQLAFSRIGLPWDNALLISLHGKSLRYEPGDIPGLLARHDLVAALTDKEHGPAAIAQSLAAIPALRSSCVVFVCERLGYEDERITEGSPGEIAALSFDEPNVAIVRRTGEIGGCEETGSPEFSVMPAEAGIQGFQDVSSDLDPGFRRGDDKRRAPSHFPGTGAPPPRFGLREEELLHSGGLITKDEVRAVSLHALRLPEEGVLWDIGAGAGSISIEAARLCPALEVFAIEKDEEQQALIRKNCALFSVPNVTVFEGAAPERLVALPAPDRVFVGGSGGKLAGIVDTARSRMQKSGIIVVNAATLETLHEACGALERAGLRLKISEVSVARSKPVGGKRYLASLNPIFVITGEKQQG